MKKVKTLKQALPWILVIGGIIGFICAFIIMFEKLHLLANPAYKPSCSINPIISCGSVMSSWQGSVFGFPNPILGLAGFSIVTTIGMAMLAGAKFKRWFWLGLQAGAIFGVVFVHWLFFQSVYRIEALCPYCIVVWTVTIPIFWYTTLHNLREGFIATPKRLKGLANFLQRHHGDILIVWFIVIAGLILHHFWYYWQTLL
ncbi:MAG: Vitamin epoxide reductase [Candidatus Saccharibacteria bacterium]|nr:Vitamin epoxide reductase [Candidatus Saccharibacteria bacterium]